ncbi:peptidase inhibitor family I36 protein [Austwickia sp. TVS 96-490-7B]|uniref:peptidase inhibitor family I36 protein n=1 Tax=Austwickia sp. TVS 96-490-7B TaxID=2830843 RepID=UPI001C565ABA|nr:peptidase inhibitor family I36 protein [Austwickia sp. TVS 96-490-7B]
MPSDTRKLGLLRRRCLLILDKCAECILRRLLKRYDPRYSMQEIGIAMSKKWIAVALILGAGIGVSSPAFAVSDQDRWRERCPDQAPCFFNDLNYRGEMSWKQPGIGLVNISHKNNDQLSSWANRSYQDAAGYEHADGLGECLPMPKRQRNSWVQGWWNDRVSSWKTNGGC